MAKDRFSTLGDAAQDKDKLIRDLKQMLKELNAELDELRARLLAAGIP